MSQIKANISVSPQDVFNISTSTAGTDLGAYGTTGDGRVFRYAKAGASALVAGTLLQAPAEVASGLENLTPVAAAVGATVITLTTTSVGQGASNALAGGFLATTTAGAGYTYKIAGSAIVSNSLVITLEDPLVVALTASSKVDLDFSPWNGVIINPTTASSCPVGVAVSAIPATYFGWIQTHGPAACIASAALTVGLGVAPSTANAGNVTAATSAVATAPYVIGVALTGVAANEAGLVFLELD